jgi:membrane protein implicated in regulation of membrane protease activity
MLWWYWILLGLFLLVLEMASPGGFFAAFFGLSAVLVGILAALGLAGPPWVQWLLFSVLSVAGLATLRGTLRRIMASGRQGPVDSLVGTTAIVLEDVPPGGVGKAELRGTSWNARSEQAAAILKGQRCRVERVDGLTLWVRPE